MIKLSFKKKLNHIIIMSGGVEINFRLMKRGYDFVLGHILPISQPPPPPPPGNNFTVPYYFIYFFNNLLTVINIYILTLQLSIKLNYILYMYYQYLRAKSIQWSIINAVF